MFLSNYSVGLRIYCADRKKVIQVCQNPFAKQILMDFGIVTMKVLNSYVSYNNKPMNQRIMKKHTTAEIPAQISMTAMLPLGFLS